MKNSRTEENRLNDIKSVPNVKIFTNFLFILHCRTQLPADFAADRFQTFVTPQGFKMRNIFLTIAESPLIATIVVYFFFQQYVAALQAFSALKRARCITCNCILLPVKLYILPDITVTLNSLPHINKILISKNLKLLNQLMFYAFN